jgi:hypothetical protein
LLIGVPAPDAQRLMELLAPPGLGLAVQPAGGAPAHQPVRDVAIELVDLAAADEAAAALGQFSGLDGERALEMMLTPPCIVLDYVAPPTVDALAAALPQGGGGAPRF